MVKRGCENNLRMRGARIPYSSAFIPRPLFIVMVVSYHALVNISSKGEAGEGRRKERMLVR